MFFSRRTVSVVLAAAVALVKAQSETGDGEISLFYTQFVELTTVLS